MRSKSEIQSTLAKFGQSHLLKYWDDLTEEERRNFLNQFSSINFEESIKLFHRAQESVDDDVAKLDERMQPIPPELFGSERETPEDILEEYQEIGLEEIANGHVAVLVLAGGQATRLGVPYPKGMYSVGLPSGKTLFQIQAERIRRVSSLAKEVTGKLGKICWYIMTSGPTNAETAKYLEKHNYFGLNKNDVVLFEQHLLPCFDFEGKIILDEKNKVALAPEGNGGIYRALKDKGIIDNMKSKGIKYVHVHSVDNILVKVADPVFMGYCVKKQADCAAKVVSKDGPNEAVGVVCQVDGKFQVVEYSEITEATANLRNPDGSLVFSAGNICNHFFSTEFLEKIANEHEQQLKLHVAKKKIPYINEKGQKIKPGNPNGIKIEKFIFDVFEFSNKFVTWEVPRHSEFSALKNTDSVGKDCASTSRRDLLSLHKQYIEQAGGTVGCDEVEISPLLSYSGENLEIKVKGKAFNTKTVILSDNEELIVESNGIINGY